MSDIAGDGANTNDHEDNTSLRVDTEPAALTHRSDRIRYAGVLFILLTTMFKNLSLFALEANLVLFCQDFLKLPTPVPSTVTLLFEGTCWFTPMIGGWLADQYIGRYNAIYGSALSMLVGTSLLCSVSYDYGPTYVLERPANIGFLALALAFIAIGNGGIASNISPFGASQVLDLGSRAVERYFLWANWFSMIGSLLALTVVLYVQQQYSFFFGYLLLVISTFLCVAMFFCGSRIGYLHEPLYKKARVSDIIKITWYGAKGLCQRSSSRDGDHWLDRVRMDRGGKWSRDVVNDTKRVVKFVPVLLLFIVYWTVDAQSAVFTIQAKYMKLKASNSFTVPAAAVNVTSTVAYLITLPLLDRCFYPLLRRCGLRVTPMQRIGAGFLFMAGSVFAAALVEVERKRLIGEHGYIQQVVFGSTYNASDMVVFYQIPQYVMTGVSGALSWVSVAELAFTQSPEYLRGLVMALALVAIGLGDYLASALVAIVRSVSASWYPTNDINKGHLEYYFFLVTGLMLVNIVAFLAFSVCCFKYRKVTKESDEVNCEGESVGDLPVCVQAVGITTVS